MHVGVFLMHPLLRHCASSLPHARGGVSKLLFLPFGQLRSSPCTWGCFLLASNYFLHPCVFPMHVGVFLAIKISVRKLLCLPHARGGVSTPAEQAAAEQASSPCTWGCFHSSAMTIPSLLVFPMHVGVFLECIFSNVHTSCLPHARGGVSCELITHTTTL